MCGIVGYIGQKEAVPVLIDGLKRLEYRGYDSAGIAVLNGKGVETRKACGKLKSLQTLLEEEPLDATIGIGHTRWATHGAPSNRNAHPHTCCKGHIAVVHNGIIENYLDLKKRLEEKGHVFNSETDTEVIVHLIEDYYEGDIVKAVMKALKEVEGSYAIGVINMHEPDKIVAARQDSPLVIGLGKGENYIASDIPAFLPFTRKVQHVDDKEVVVITRKNVTFYNLDGKKIQRPVLEVHWDDSMAEKSGYKHFMLKEIFEQPRVVADNLNGRLLPDGVHIEEMKLSDGEISSINKILITACGTAFHAGMIGKYFIEEYARIPVEIDIASELRYRNPVIDDKTLMIAISQSGETADTLVSFRDSIARGAMSIAITNVIGSSITRETQNYIFTRAGLEIGVAATKTFTAQVVALILITLKIGLTRGSIDQETYARLRQSLLNIPNQIEEVLKSYEDIRSIARKYYKCQDVLFLGRNICYPVALEGALKLKEISYVHAEGYAAGEMKHGPIALIDGMVPVISVLPKGPVYEKILSNVKEVRARNAVTIGIVNDGDEHIGEYLDEKILIPETEHVFSPILATVPLQLLSYFIADKKDRDVDQPRNLAKSVTVE